MTNKNKLNDKAINKVIGGYGVDAVSKGNGVYECPNCRGDLISFKKDKYKCESCGNTYGLVGDKLLEYL